MKTILILFLSALILQAAPSPNPLEIYAIPGTGSVLLTRIQHAGKTLIIEFKDDIWTEWTQLSIVSPPSNDQWWAVTYTAGGVFRMFRSYEL